MKPAAVTLPGPAVLVIYISSSILTRFVSMRVFNKTTTTTEINNMTRTKQGGRGGDQLF